MGISEALKKILVDRGETTMSLAERMGKSKQTLYNTMFRNEMYVNTAIKYGKALGCTLCYVDDETGEIYKIG